MAAPATSTSTPRPGKNNIPGSPIERTQELVAAMDRLSQVLARELALARYGAAADVTALQGEKRALTSRVDEISRLLRLDRAGLTAMPPELLLRLKESTRQLSDITAANHDALDILAEAQKSVVDLVVKTVNQGQRADLAYSKIRPGIAPVRTPRPVASGYASSFNAVL